MRLSSYALLVLLLLRKHVLPLLRTYMLPLLWTYDTLVLPLLRTYDTHVLPLLRTYDTLVLLLLYALLVDIRDTPFYGHTSKRGVGLACVELNLIFLGGGNKPGLPADLRVFFYFSKE